MKSQSSVPFKSIDKEVEDYLCYPNIATNSLLKYPHLLQAFLKFSAVERLFSCAGQILIPRRCKLSDTMFEKLVFLRCKMNNHNKTDKTYTFSYIHSFRQYTAPLNLNSCLEVLIYCCTGCN